MTLFGRSGNKQLFNGWITAYHGSLFKHALWMTGNKDTAMDMVQEAFYQAWLAIDSLQDKNKVLPWLLTILRRATYREQRCQYRQLETVEQLSILDGELLLHDNYLLLEIYSALERLSTAQREVFLLHHLHGFSYEEISEQLQIPLGTVMSRLGRAREALRQLQSSDDHKIVSIHSKSRQVE